MRVARRPLALVLAAGLIAAGLSAAAPSPAEAAPPLRVGVGRADITPPTGYYLMGWVRSDAVSRGQHTRLFARAVVLERGGKKVALVAMDIGAIAGGLIVEAGENLKGRGFSERNILVSASHTHSGPGGFFNYSTYNTTFMTATTLTDQNIAGARDQQLYAFLVRQLTEAIRRADDDLAPGRVGWGSVDLLGVTANRSLEAHLANHGIETGFGTGRVSDDPGGYRHTIDPTVDVLRVDKTIGGRAVPVGMWSTFANHGTVNHHSIGVYNADHHGPTERFVEDAIRAAGDVPAGQDVVNAYGNTDEGDVSSGLKHRGPVHAEAVGRKQAAAMLLAWREAGRRMTSTPAIDLRWTRACFCGQEVEGGRVDDQAVVGLPLFTGSEEGRGPLFDITHVPFEGRRLPAANPALPEQGTKIPVPIPQAEGSVPTAVPFLAVRIADRLVVSVPGEMTAGMGHRLKAAVGGAARPMGIRGVVISGLANEYLQYFTTPEEYTAQHYEGGSTLYGTYTSNLVLETLVDLASRMARGAPAPEAAPFDPTNGVSPDAEPFSSGAEAGAAVEQPHGAQPTGMTSFVWDGGVRGFDRPLDRAFVSIVRSEPSGEGRAVADDLGLQIVWTVDDEGRYTATWHVPRRQPAGDYRFVITANRYRVVSDPFRIGRGGSGGSGGAGGAAAGGAVSASGLAGTGDAGATFACLISA